jgi:hypothetical protein
LDAESGAIVDRETVVSGLGYIVAATEQDGRFVALVAVGGPIEVAGAALPDIGFGFTTLLIDLDGKAHRGDILEAPDLFVWHPLIAASAHGDFAITFAFNGELDFGGEVFVAPALDDGAGPSSAIVSFDPNGRALRTVAFITSGSMRVPGVAVEADGTARAVIGVSDEAVDIGGAHIDGTSDEARAIIAVDPSGAVSAETTQVERIWGQPDGSALALTVSHEAGVDVVRIVALP